VQYAVLNAIGCGTFLNTMQNPEQFRLWYAQSLCDVLQIKDYNLKGIVIVVPDHYAIFQKTLLERQKTLRVTVAVTRIHSMLDIALYLMCERCVKTTLSSSTVGILNASDESFVRKGEMAWLNTQRVSMQSVLAVKTHLLYQLFPLNLAWTTSAVAVLYDIPEEKVLLQSERYTIVWTHMGVQSDIQNMVNQLLQIEMKPETMWKSWVRDRKDMTNFMSELLDLDGKVWDYTFQRKTGAQLEAGKEYSFEGSTIEGRHLIRLMDATTMSFLAYSNEKMAMQELVDNTRMEKGDTRLAVYDDSLCAVTGPVYMLVNPKNGEVIISEMVEVLCVSIPGIEFTNSDHSRHFAETGASSKIPNQAAHLRMAEIWHHALSLFQQRQVTHPVLCAI
jgi:hypothetical protein